jgi:hypothetical protein
MKIIKSDPNFKKIIFKKLYTGRDKIKLLDRDIKKVLKKYDPDLQVSLDVDKKSNGKFQAILYSESIH